MQPYGSDKRDHEGLIQALNDDGTLDPAHDPKLTADEIRHIYRHMVQTRWLDERLTALQRQGRIGFHVGSLGEEASIIASAFSMRQQDWLPLLPRVWCRFDAGLGLSAIHRQHVRQCQ
jgi:hypothetical protein